jgi:ribosomal-protein-alanine N-acetyltransferase
MVSRTRLLSRRQPELALPGRYRLRGWEVEDAPGLLQAMQDPMVLRYAGFLVADTAEARLRIQRYATGWATGDGIAWVVSDAERAVLGAVRFGLIDRDLECGMVGYWLLPQVRGAGLASTAVRFGTDLALGMLGWHRVELRHALENERSCAVAHRCGYRLEGTMRDGMRYPSDGRWSDEHLHARLATDQSPPADQRGRRSPRARQE